METSDVKVTAASAAEMVFTPEEEAAAIAEAMRQAQVIKAAETAPVNDFVEVNTRELSEADMAYAEEIMRRAAAENSKAVFEATDTEWCSSSGDVGVVISRYVRHVMRTERRAVRLYELNKRFGWDLQKYDATTRGACQILTQTGQLDYKLNKGVAVYLDPVILGYEQKNKPREERDRIKEEYVKRAFFSSKR